ncbi:MAG: DJ-1/PfpI family protein [Alphaproteobacteria bacterium]|nr:DJ-1/PfpI family protein [Alphaproteobacteria bacterium]
MTSTLADKNIAILAANGFDEKHITTIQRALTKDKISHKVIAPEQGLVNGWQDNAWGHYFTVDTPINTALGSDFDALVLVGGERAAAKLKTNLHARRIVNHFLEAQKPVAAIGAGVSLLALSGKSAGLEVAAPAEFHDELKAANMTSVAEDQVADGLVLTSTGADVDAWVEAVLALFSEASGLEQAA